MEIVDSDWLEFRPIQILDSVNFFIGLIKKQKHFENIFSAFKSGDTFYN